eukprot:9526778-Alexandrium_andersonii.AAC.1
MAPTRSSVASPPVQRTLSRNVGSASLSSGGIKAVRSAVKVPCQCAASSSKKRTKSKASSHSAHTWATHSGEPWGLKSSPSAPWFATMA